jgi:hypothetical protein
MTRVVAFPFEAALAARKAIRVSWATGEAEWAKELPV